MAELVDAPDSKSGSGDRVWVRVPLPAPNGLQQPSLPMNSNNPDTPSSHRRTVWLLAWPLILSNLTVPLLGLVDTAVMGHLPDSRYLGGVTLGAMLFSFLYWGFGFLRMGTTGLAAQRTGAEDTSGQRLVLAQALLVAFALGILLIALQIPLVTLGLWLLDGSAEVTDLAREYATIRMWSAPAVLANYVLIGWFLGLGNSRFTLWLMLVNNLVNIVLDLVFVLGLGMTVDGVALASVIADYSALALGLWLCLRTLRRLGGRLPVPELSRLAAYRELFSVNSALFIRTLLLLFAMAFFTSQGARQGDVILAANAVLMQFIMLTSFGLDGFAHAAESLVGRAVGRRDIRLFRAHVRAAAEWSLGVAGAFALVFALGGNLLVAMLTDIGEVRDMAAIFLPWMVVMPLLAVWSYLLDGIFIGATRTKEMRDTMLLAVIGAYLPLWFVTQEMGNHGLWLAFTGFIVVRSTLLGGVFWLEWRRGRWIPQTPARSTDANP
jgi:multidrug resistance protein, MATE family